MDDEGDAPTLLTDEHVRLLGLPGDTQDSLAESTIGAATQGEIRRKVLAQLVDRSCSDDVVAAACQVLGLLGRSGLQAEEESFHETVEALMEVLRRDSASAEVVASSCASIVLLLKGHRAQVGFAGVSATLVPLTRAISHSLSNARVARAGARALVSLLAAGSRDVRPPPAAAGAMAAAMRAHAGTLGVLEAAAEALQLLCWHPEMARRAWQEEAPPALCLALGAFPASRTLAMHSCSALLLLFLHKDMAPHAPGGARVVDEWRMASGIAAAQALCAHPGDAGVAERASRLLASMSAPGGAGGDGVGVQLLVGGDGEVLEQVWRAVGDVGMQGEVGAQEACWRLIHAGGTRPLPAPSRRRLGGLEAGSTVAVIVDLMARHRESAGLVEHLCWALGEAATEGAGRHDEERAVAGRNCGCRGCWARRSEPGETRGIRGAGDTSVDAHQGQPPEAECAACRCGQCEAGAPHRAALLGWLLRRHVRAGATHETACAAALAICRGSAVNCVAMREAGLVGALVAALRSDLRSATLHQNGWQCVSRLLLGEGGQAGGSALSRRGARCGGKGAWTEELVLAGGVDALVAALRFHRMDGAVVAALLPLFRAVSWEVDLRAQVGEKGGVEAVLEAGVSHLSNAVVAEESCGCLHALVWGAQNKAAMVQLVGERVVVEAMRAHPNNLAVQFEAVACLAVLSFCVDDNKLRIGDAGAIPLILAAMRRFGTDGGLQGQGCFALWSLCSSTPPSMPGHDKDLAKIMVEQNRKDVVSGDGVGVVLGALHRQGGDVEVCELACRALGSVVYGNVATCGLAAKKVFDEGDRGLGRIAVLMGHHSSSPSFLTQAAFAIKNVVSELNKDEKNTKRDMGLQKLARPLTEAMRLHAGEISVHNQTVAALGNVAVNGMANKHMGMGGERGMPPALAAVLASMRAFPSSAELQRRACTTLFNMHRNDGAVAVLLRTKALRPLDRTSGLPCVFLAVLGAAKAHARDAATVTMALVVLRELVRLRCKVTGKTELVAGCLRELRDSLLPRIVREMRDIQHPTEKVREAQEVTKAWDLLGAKDVLPGLTAL